jgi:hypothetical protein
MKVAQKIFLLSLSVIILIVGCKKQDQVERIWEEGVEVVLNKLEPYRIKGDPTTLHLEKEYSIDTESDAVAETGLTDIHYFDVDSEGNLYFLNRRSGEDVVFKFDPKGNFLSSFGRKGQGPGELMSPSNLTVDYKDDIVIQDIVGKIVIFGKEGSFKGQINTKQIFAGALPLENANYLATKRIFNYDGNYVEWPILLCGPDFEVIKEFDKHTGPNYRGKWGFPEDTLVYCVSEGKIFIGNSASGYEIRVFDPSGNLKRKIRKEYRPIEVTEELKKNTLEGLEDSPLAFMTEGIFFRKHCPAFQYFFTDDEGYVFVMTYEESEKSREYLYDIFDSSGIFVSRIYLGNMVMRGSIGRKFATAKNRLLYCLREKENAHKKLVVYRMRWE